MNAPASSPRRLTWFAVVLPPGLWMAQGVAGWYLGGHGCPATGGALSAHAVRVAVCAVTLVAIATVAGLLVLKFNRQRAVVSGADAAAERSRFVATLATVAGLTLLVGLALAGLPALMVQTCGQAR